LFLLCVKEVLSTKVKQISVRLNLLHVDDLTDFGIDRKLVLFLLKQTIFEPGVLLLKFIYFLTESLVVMIFELLLISEISYLLNINFFILTFRNFPLCRSSNSHHIVQGSFSLLLLFCLFSFLALELFRLTVISFLLFLGFVCALDEVTDFILDLLFYNSYFALL